MPSMGGEQETETTASVRVAPAGTANVEHAATQDHSPVAAGATVAAATGLVAAAAAAAAAAVARLGRREEATREAGHISVSPSFYAIDSLAYCNVM
jgi:hypothetical protein